MPAPPDAHDEDPGPSARRRRSTYPRTASGDLQSKRAIIIKAGLFLLLGCLAGGLLLGSILTLRNVFLLGLTIWSFCRFYYFAFYVIEHYLDSSYQYRGLVDLIRHYWRRR
ncbi:hypothetical protein [Allorhodopirellula solitaria]|uniref:Transmembrane protein n=1 Tax=Allorhodopirellula solitaria TaxID=2527987 RepID=A0A5C5WPH9_9BACT|nr:hypothetical protein [Allorhodopirellula solitaria]TWT52165.1 hypothetical protein CA85_50800 [Allorhodopirellula solitaria]